MKCLHRLQGSALKIKERACQLVKVIVTVFHKPAADATRIMLDVHRSGSGVAGIYPFDVADTKVAQVRTLAEAKEFPLLCTLEPEA